MHHQERTLLSYKIHYMYNLAYKVTSSETRNMRLTHVSEQMTLKRDACYKETVRLNFKNWKQKTLCAGQLGEYKMRVLW